MAQNIFEIPEVQDALRNLDSLSVPALAPSDYPNAKFFPPSALHRFDSKRLSEILRSIPSTKDAARRLAREIVMCECVSVFLVLLRMGQPAMIDHFMRFDTLSDKRLPLGDSGDFPAGLSFHDFAQHQQPFCAPKIREGNRNFLNERILPLTGREELAEGGSAKVFRIEIHPEFDDLEREARVIDPHIYVAKVYRLHEDEAYQNELEAYTKIRDTGKWDDSLLRYYGTFTHRGERTVLLEYANGSTWEDFMQRPQPARTEDKISVWKGLLGLLKAVHRIHLASGWHQDINPNNIVLHMPEGVVRWPHIAKLVDLGHSFFANGEGSQLGRERFGTKDYGAPECYRSPNDKFELGTRRLVSNNIDVFSLGCVFLEAAVWFSDGPAGLMQFRDDRRAEAKSAGMEEGIVCFHDDSELLGCVRSRLKSLGQADGPHDPLTAKICEYLIPGMIHAHHKSRSEAEGLWKKAADILKSAQDALDPPKSGIERLHLLNGETSSGNCDSTMGISGAFVHNPAPRLGSEGLPFGQNVLVESPRMLPQPGPSDPVDTMRQGPENRKAFTLADEESAKNFLNGTPSSQTADDFVGPSHRQSQSRANTAPTDQSRQPNDIASNHLRSAQLHVLDDKPMVFRSRPKPRPKMTLHQASEFIDGRRDLTRDERDLKKRLKNRDHSFILDNSHSTSSHWKDMCAAFRILASMVQDDDPDGIELRFTTSEECHQSRDVAELYRSATRATAGHGSSVEAALQKAVDQHVSLLKKDTTRLLSIYILTDGHWDHGEPEALLLQLVHWLGELGLNRSSLGVQFISFGDDKIGLQRLQTLDDMHKGTAFDLKLDIVDTVSCNGNVWKMLLGSIDRAFDED